MSLRRLRERFWNWRKNRALNRYRSKLELEMFMEYAYLQLEDLRRDSKRTKELLKAYKRLEKKQYQKCYVV